MGSRPWPAGSIGIQARNVSTPIWQPPPARCAASNMRRFIDVNRARLRGDDYAALYDWSIESPTEFWEETWRFCEIKAAAPYDTVLRDASRMPGAKWFEGAKL